VLINLFINLKFFKMKNLVESQEFNDQVNQSELEDIQGGCGTVGCLSGFVCSGNFSDEDNNDNVVF